MQQNLLKHDNETISQYKLRLFKGKQSGQYDIT